MVMRTLWMMLLAAVSVGAQSHGANGHSAQEVPLKLTEAEQAWVRTHPQVRWGVDPHWPPFSSWNRDRQLIGIDADITRLVAARAGLRLTIVPGESWSEVLARAKAG